MTYNQLPVLRIFSAVYTQQREWPCICVLGESGHVYVC
jgi:hypothetical protein